jgi:hypothetical protein
MCPSTSLTKITSTSQANATGSSNSLGDADELPPGFFDDMEVNAHVRHHHHHQ